jgi:hypothetical protein
MTEWYHSTETTTQWECRGYGVYHHFQQYFSNIMAVRFMGGGNHRASDKL